MKSKYKLFFLLLIALPIFAGCGGHHHDHDVVEWKSLNKLDVLVEGAGALASSGDFTKLKAQVPAILKAVDTLVSGGIPENVAHKKETQQLLDDLKSLALSYSQKPMLDDKDLTTLAKSIHQIVVKMMEEAGVPHVH